MYEEKLFFLNGKRAMISLGPLTEKCYCPYKCAFCYVQDGFRKYVCLDEDEIIGFLHKNRSEYDIVYVSGDTDSFAPPRTDRALKLLERIVMEFDVDLLFTTRATFKPEHYTILKRISSEQKRTENYFFACISITRYSENVAYIEPAPIPSPEDRIETIRRLKEIGATTVVAMRPFLPVVSVDDYITILERARGCVDIALGEAFYFTLDGDITKRVFPKGFRSEWEKDITHNNKMLFDYNEQNWEVWNSLEYERVVQSYCEKNNIIFSMHSEDAINRYIARDIIVKARNDK